MFLRRLPCVFFFSGDVPGAVDGLRRVHPLLLLCLGPEDAVLLVLGLFLGALGQVLLPVGSCVVGYILESIILSRVWNLVSASPYLLSSCLIGAVSSSYDLFSWQAPFVLSL